MIEPSVAIILVNWNSYDFSVNCINSLNKCNYKNFKIILVDNGSKDLSIDKLSLKFKDIHFIKNKSNLGFTGANNIGISSALKQKYDYIMLLNNDTVVEKNFLKHLVVRFENDNKIGAIQPLILQMNNPDKIWNAGGKFFRLIGLPIVIGNGKNIKAINLKKHYTDWISGCCIMLKSKIIDEIGLLDNSFFAYFEDVDWSLRIKNAGYFLGIEKSSIIYHYESGSSKSNSKSKEGYLDPMIHYYNFRNHIKLIKKHKKYFGIFFPYFFQIFKFLIFSFYFIIRFRFVKLKKMLQGFIDGINS
ncbi:glycosyltransferase family 2 protein [Flavobacteriaceae bacterium]|nr:glycosyltransferase family 2 protein [Flavobacteriaceae bacterium]